MTGTPRDDNRAALAHILQTRFGVPPDRVRWLWAPYRICPLGAHIDHQLGTVTAMAIDRGTLLAYAPSPTRELRLVSRSYPGEVRFTLDRIPDRVAGDWGNYARGAARALGERHTLARGIVGCTSGDLGEIGLSSSASIGLAYLLALQDANGLTLSPADNILLDQAIENRYLGLNNGILDQSAILLSRRDRLTVIDCRAFASFATGGAGAEPDTNEAPADASVPGVTWVERHARMPPFVILLANSGVTQPIVSTRYNERVAECGVAARLLLEAAGRSPEPAVLGRVRPAEYAAHQARLNGATARRACHFFGEMQRVQAGMAAWREGDLERFGALMTASGRSSIECYECGCPPLIDLYEILVRTPGIYGARFSGAGFRGCCVALADPAALEHARIEIERGYVRAQPEWAVHSRLVVCQPDEGARCL